MESAPINLQGPLAQRRALLAKLLAQQQAGGRGAGFRAGVMGGHPAHNASDLMGAPLPQINVGFRAAPGHQMAPGFHFDPTTNAPLTQFPGSQPFAGGSAPPPDAPGGGDGSQSGQTLAPANFDGALRGLTPAGGSPYPGGDFTPPDYNAGYTPYMPPDPWAVFRGPSRQRTAMFL